MTPLLFAACDSCQEIGPAILDECNVGLIGAASPSSASHRPGVAVWDTEAAEWMVRDGYGYSWPSWDWWAAEHEGHELVIVTERSRVAEVQRPGWWARTIHGPWPYEIEPRGKVDHVDCGTTPGQSCGKTHALRARVTGPGRMAQAVVCPHCGAANTVWYWSERYGPWVQCRGCSNPSGPGADQHWAREALRVAGTDEPVTRATLVADSIPVPESGTAGAVIRRSVLDG